MDAKEQIEEDVSTPRHSHVNRISSVQSLDMRLLPDFGDDMIDDFLRHTTIEESMSMTSSALYKQQSENESTIELQRVDNQLIIPPIIQTEEMFETAVAQTPCVKFCVCCLGILCIAIVVAENAFFWLSYWSQSNADFAGSLYIVTFIISSTVFAIIMFASIFNQRDNIKVRMSLTINAILMLVALFYSLCAANFTFFEELERQTGKIFGVLSALSIILMAPHFVIESLQWAKVHNKSNFTKYSINWWSCLFLMITLFASMIKFSIYPLLQLTYEATRTQSTIRNILLYYCRPFVIVVLYRSIEQIWKQLSTQRRNAHMYVDPKAYVLMKDDTKNAEMIRFDHISVMDIIIWLAVMLFFVVSDLLSTILNAETDIYHLCAQINLIVWFLFVAVLCILNMMMMSKYIGVILDVNRILKKHMSLLIMAIGFILSIIGNIGVREEQNSIFETQLSSVLHAVCIVMQSVVMVLLNESSIIIIIIIN